MAVKTNEGKVTLKDVHELLGTMQKRNDDQMAALVKEYRETREAIRVEVDTQFVRKAVCDVRHENVKLQIDAKALGVVAGLSAVVSTVVVAAIQLIGA